jgi:hypothetical protein
MWTPTHIPNYSSSLTNAIRGLGWDTVQVTKKAVTEVTKNGGKVGCAAQLDVYNQVDNGVFVAYNIAAMQSLAAETVANAVHARLSTGAVRGTAVNAKTGNRSRECPSASTPTTMGALARNATRHGPAWPGSLHAGRR